MGLMDSVLDGDSFAFCDPDMMTGAEQITYTPGGGSPRTINANVDRSPPAEISDSGGGATGVVDVFIRYHATLGTTSIDTGRDKFTLAPRRGGTVRVFKVGQILSQGGGGFKLRLLGPSA